MAPSRNQDCLSPSRQEREEKRNKNVSILGDLCVFARDTDSVGSEDFAQPVAKGLHATTRSLRPVSMPEPNSSVMGQKKGIASVGSGWDNIRVAVHASIGNHANGNPASKEEYYAQVASGYCVICHSGPPMGVCTETSPELSVKTKAEDTQNPRTIAEESPGDHVTYSVIDSYTLPGIKRSLTVLLSAKVSEDALRDIALKLKAQDPRYYERTFIGYYLPGMELGRIAWATTHFRPELEIRFLGSSLEQEESFRKQVVPSPKGVIGTWLYEIPGGADMNRTYTIYHEDGTLYLKTTYTDGGGGAEVIKEKAHRMGRLFQTTGQATRGEYFLLDEKGNLQYWDREGCFAIARKLK